MRVQKRCNFGQICICRTVDLEAVQLGWAVCVLVRDTGTISKEPSNGSGFPHAEYLALRHCEFEVEANICKQGFLNFLRDEKRFMQQIASIYEFWEFNAVKQASDEFWWTILEDKALTDFQSDEYTLVIEPEDWHPDEPNSLSIWIKNTPEC